MKTIVIIFLLVVAVYFIGPKVGIEMPLGGSESAAVKTYKEFANAFVVNEYDKALLLSSGQAIKNSTISIKIKRLK